MRAPRIRVEIAEFAPQEIQQGTPRAPARVDFAQGGSSRPILGIDLEDLLQGRDGVVMVAELFDPQFGDAVVERHLLGRIRDDLGLAHENAREIAPAALRLVALGQRDQRLGVIGPQRQDGGVGIDDHHLKLQAIAVDGHHVEIALDLLVDLTRRQRLASVFKQFQKGVPLLGFGIETAERIHRLGQTGPDTQEQLPRVDGLFKQLRTALGHGGHLDAELNPYVGIGFVLLSLAEQHEQLRNLVARKVVLAIEGDEPRVRRLRLLHPAKTQLGLVQLVQALPVEFTERERGGHLGLPPLRGSQRCLVQFNEVGRFISGRKQIVQGIVDSLVAWGGQQGLPVVILRLRPVTHLLGQVAGSQLGRALVLGRGRVRAPTRQVLGQFHRSASLPQQTFEREVRPAILWVKLQAAADHGLGFFGHRAMAQQELALGGEQRRSRGPFAGLRSLGRERFRLLLPGRILDVEFSLHGRRGGKVGNQLQRLLHYRARRLELPELARQDPRLVDEKLGPRRGLARDGQLKIEETDTKAGAVGLGVKGPLCSKCLGQFLAGGVRRLRNLKPREDLQCLGIVRIKSQGSKGSGNVVGHVGNPSLRACRVTFCQAPDYSAEHAAGIGKATFRKRFFRRVRGRPRRLNRRLTGRLNRRPNLSFHGSRPARVCVCCPLLHIPPNWRPAP